MEIIIGRNQNTRQLAIIKDGVEKNFGHANSVSMDVSRHHISLVPAGNGKWRIKNLNERNVTFVNGIAVESKTISENDKVELGNSHYLFQWSALSEPKTESIDIRPLKYVWDEYNQRNIELKVRKKNIGLLSSIPIGFTMLGGLIAGVASDEIKPYAYVFTAIALVVMVYGFYRRFTDDSISEEEEIKKDFQRRYICPNPQCAHFMGFQDYDILVQNNSCPYCKMKYKK